MKETIAFASWNFIRIKCGVHLEELKLPDTYGKPNYCCPHKACAAYVPDVIYEKLLEDTVSKLNSNSLAVGSRWKKRYSGRVYECIVLSSADGKRPEIGVRVLG